MTTCASFLGHKYRPRYDRIPPHPESFCFESASIGAIERFIEAMTKTIYVRDVCVRCGHVIEREVTP